MNETRELLSGRLSSVQMSLSAALGIDLDNDNRVNDLFRTDKSKFVLKGLSVSIWQLHSTLANGKEQYIVSMTSLLLSK